MSSRTGLFRAEPRVRCPASADTGYRGPVSIFLRVLTGFFDGGLVNNLFTSSMTFRTSAE